MNQTYTVVRISEEKQPGPVDPKTHKPGPPVVVWLVTYAVSGDAAGQVQRHFTTQPTFHVGATFTGVLA